MLKVWTTLFFCLPIASANAICQVPGNVISRVFQIRYNGETGTVFILDYEDHHYFVTANHMVATAGDNAVVELMSIKDGTWKNLSVQVLHGSNACDDVAVLIPSEPLPKVINIEPLPALPNFYFGQEVYFLGFPYGLYTTFGNAMPVVPLIKHGYVSARVTCASMGLVGREDQHLVLLDGMNNPGFSGGPVVGPDLDTVGHPIKLLGIISGYRNDASNIVVHGEKAPEVFSLSNSGIILVIPIKSATDLLVAHFAAKSSGAK